MTFGQKPLCLRLKEEQGFSRVDYEHPGNPMDEEKEERKTAFTKDVVQDKSKGAEGGRAWKAYQKESI